MRHLRQQYEPIFQMKMSNEMQIDNLQRRIFEKGAILYKMESKRQCAIVKNTNAVLIT